MVSAVVAALAGAVGAVAASAIPASCPDYTTYSQQDHGPYSTGKYHLSYQRPSPQCRTFTSQPVNDLINKYQHLISDPDLYRLFENAYPNTLDTTIAWKGFAANNSAEELCFVITGDINAMWLRDSANQMQSYLPILTASNSQDSIASLYRGVINLQSRYLLEYPYCQSFQPPVESKIPPSVNGAANDDMVVPPYSNQTVFECKFELDSLAAFMEVSYNYYNKTQDIDFFKKFQWVATMQTIMNVANSMMIPTYTPNGSVLASAYTFERLTFTSEDTLDNSGDGNPVQSGTGLIRSAFRPSDDSCIYQLFIPANMMFSRYLAATAPIMAQMPGQAKLAGEMRSLAQSLRSAIAAYGIVHNTPKYGSIYAYEVDGYGSVNSMDDANVPSLLAAPFFGYLDVNDPIYQATRRKVLSTDNPYFMHGPVIDGVGGPHDGPGFAWPMASIIRIFTSNDDEEIYSTLKKIVSSTDGLGLIHESINTFNQSDWTRQWFSWANGLFGQMIIDLKARKPYLLQRSYQ